MKRNHNLDYLRGLSALMIMIYHHCLWQNGIYNADSFLGRIGIYGVSIFYILSGLTLYLVYFDKMELSIEAVKDFFIKRIFRIYPLLILVTFASLFFKCASLKTIALNITGLFGFIAWDKGIATGSWSIGNELVFYVLFVISLFLLKLKPALFLVFTGLLFLLGIYTSNYYINHYSDLHTEFGKYQNPLNQAFLFMAGFLTGHFFKKKKLSRFESGGLVIIGLLLFVFFPIEGDRINLVTGVNRFILSGFCLMICVGIYKLSFKIPYIIHAPLKYLGEVSYSIYLLHPLVYKTLKIFVNGLPDIYFNIISFTATAIVSYFVYNYIEKRFVSYGKVAGIKLINRKGRLYVAKV